MSPLTILDCNNFWSPTGGGVRQYQVQKLEYFAALGDMKYIFAMPDRFTATEDYAANVCIEHVRAVKEPGAGDYRYILDRQALQRIVQTHRPDVIEIGSPLFLPWLIRGAIRGLQPRPALVGFWHDDFPRTHIGRPLRIVSDRIRHAGERFGWWWMRRAYASFDAMFVASRRVGEHMRRHGFSRLYYTPLGVDTKRFHTGYRDEELVHRIKAGIPDRLTIFYPHRLSDEKGLGCLLEAYPGLCERLPHAPALVFAGIGPGQDRVVRAAERYEHVHYLGYLDQPDDLARWYASCDMALVLSAFETFGLSTAEAMASGLALVGADEGSAAELIEQSGCGLTVPYGDVHALASAITELVRENAMRERGLRGSRYIEPFTWMSTFTNEIACYRDVLHHVRQNERVPEGFHDLIPADLVATEA